MNFFMFGFYLPANKSFSKAFPHHHTPTSMAVPFAERVCGFESRCLWRFPSNQNICPKVLGIFQMFLSDLFLSAVSFSLKSPMDSVLSKSFFSIVES